MPTRALRRVDGSLRIDQAVTLDGTLLESISPTYRVLLRAGSVQLATGSLAPDAGPGLFAAVVTEAAVVERQAEELRVETQFTYAGLLIEEDADVQELAKVVQSAEFTIEVEEVLVEVEAAAGDEIEVEVEESAGVEVQPSERAVEVDVSPTEIEVLACP